MNKVRVPLLLVILSLPISVFSAGPAVQSQIVFAPPGQTENPVTLKFNGKIYQDKSTFSEMTNKGAALNDEERLVIKAIEVNTRGDRKELLSLWHPDERTALEPKINDPELYAKNVSLYKNVLSSRFMAMMRYGQFTLCFVEHELRGAGSYVKMYPIVKFNDRYYLSNKLSGDFFYENFSFQLSEYFKKRK